MEKIRYTGNMPLLLFLIILIFGYLFYLRWISYTSLNGVPYVPLAPDVVNRIITMSEVEKEDVFYDLGSGDGRVVIAAAMKGAKAIGVESDWLRVWYSRLWIKIMRLDKRAKIIHGDIFKQDLSDATVVCTYLLQETNDRLQEKLERELKKRTRVVSAAFIYKGWKLVKTDLRGTPYGPLYLYRI